MVPKSAQYHCKIEPSLRWQAAYATIFGEVEKSSSPMLALVLALGQRQPYGHWDDTLSHTAFKHLNRLVEQQVVQNLP